MDEFERTLVELESLFEDPLFRKSLDEVKEINQLLDGQPVSEQEANQIIDELNAKWHNNGFYERESFISVGVHTLVTITMA